MPQVTVTRLERKATIFLLIVTIRSQIIEVVAPASRHSADNKEQPAMELARLEDHLLSRLDQPNELLRTLSCESMSKTEPMPTNPAK